MIYGLIRFLFPKTFHEIFMEGYANGQKDLRLLNSFEEERKREEETLRLRIGK